MIDFPTLIFEKGKCPRAWGCSNVGLTPNGGYDPKIQGKSNFPDNH